MRFSRSSTLASRCLRRSHVLPGCGRGAAPCPRRLDGHQTLHRLRGRRTARRAQRPFRPAIPRAAAAVVARPAARRAAPVHGRACPAPARGRVRRVSLASLADFFGVPTRPCHRALPDAESTAQVLVCLIGLAQEGGARRVSDLRSLAAPRRDGSTGNVSSSTGHRPGRRLSLPRPLRPGPLRREGARSARAAPLVLRAEAPAGVGRGRAPCARRSSGAFSAPSSPRRSRS